MRRSTQSYFLTLLMATLLAAPSGAAVESALDRDRIVLGETVHLTIRARSSATRSRPDFSVLEKDFRIMDIRQSMRTSIINGHSEHSVDWTLELLPMRKGQISVPPIQLGSEASPEVTIEVEEGRSASKNAFSSSQEDTRSWRGVRVVTSVDETEPYVQQQINMTVQLQSELPILDGSLSEPAIEGAIIERLGEDKGHSVEIEGHSVYQLERRYAVFPQKSGPLAVEPVIFEGQVEAPRPAPDTRQHRRQARSTSPFGGSIFDDPFFEDFFSGGAGLLDRVMGRGGQPVRAISSSVLLEVKPRPADATGDRFIPARDLHLIELWDHGENEPPIFRVGDPVERMVAVQARGVIANQLPTPNLPEVDGLKQYLEPAYEESKESNGELTATRAVPTILIPTRTGPVVLPAVALTWWDTDSNTAQTTVLPERTIEVLPGRSQEGDLAASIPATTAPGPSPPPLDGPSGAGPSQQETKTTGPLWILGWLGLATGTVFWGWSLIQRSRAEGRSNGPRALSPVRRRLSLRSAETDLRNACKSQVAEDAESALLQIGRLRWPDETILTLDQMARQIEDQEFSDAIHALCAARFASHSSDWQPTGLWRSYRKGLRKHLRCKPLHQGADVLPALYPNG